MTSPIARRSILAGVLISIGCLFSMAAAPYGPVAQGICFSVGLFGVLACRAKLFTGSVLSVMNVFNRLQPLRETIGSWCGIWAWNFVGAVWVELGADCCGFDATAIAQAKAALPWHELLVRAALCNVMVCMAVHVYDRSGSYSKWGESYLLNASLASLLPVACFIACGFEHSVADMLYMPLGLMQGAVGIADVARVLLLATAGNVIGGVAFAYLVWEGRDG